jgi:hypothetical protein
MSLPSDGEEIHLVKRETPRPRLLAHALSNLPPAIRAQEANPEKSPLRRKFFLLLAAVLVAAAIAAFAIRHTFPEKPLHPLRPGSVLKTIRQNLPEPPAPPLPVTQDLLRVTAIVLGDAPLAVVNGKTLAEGDWLEVRMAQGVAALRVTRIEDRVVHFGYAGQTIDARLPDELSPKPPH